MRKRHNQILAGVLAVQIILSVVVFWPRSVATGAGEPIFPDLAADDVVALSIADADGNTVVLQKTVGDWALPEADDYPATADKVTSLLENIVGLATGRLVTQTDASHERLQVASDDFLRRIRFETADGAEHTLYLGSSPSYGATHFRVDGQNEVYLAADISVWDTNATADSWINPLYLSVTQADVTQITLENANGKLTFVKEEAEEEEEDENAEGGGAWTMRGLKADETLDEAQVTTVLRQAASVNVTEPLGKEALAEYGMDEPQAVVTLETAEKTVTLQVGAKDPDGDSYVVKSSESPYYVRVSGFSLNSLVENARDDFLQEPPTPTPAPAPTPTPASTPTPESES
jgi:hypothetical protein